MTSMNNTFISQELELAAKRMLTRITGPEVTLKPLYLQPDRAIFLAENLHYFPSTVFCDTWQKFHGYLRGASKHLLQEI